MEKIVIIAHGSPKKEANILENLAEKLALILGKNKQDLKVAYLKHGKPLAQEAILSFIEEGAKKIIIHPLFLSKGSHVSFDIPEMIRNFKKHYPKVELLCTKALGDHEKLVYLIKDLIEEKINKNSSEIKS